MTSLVITHSEPTVQLCEIILPYQTYKMKILLNIIFSFILT